MSIRAAIPYKSRSGRSHFFDPSTNYIQVEMAPAKLTVARACLTISALANIIGPYEADWSHSHVLNPHWPPHAKFHNGQTMSIGLCLGFLIILGDPLHYLETHEGQRRYSAVCTS